MKPRRRWPTKDSIGNICIILLVPLNYVSLSISERSWRPVLLAVLSAPQLVIFLGMVLWLRYGPEV